MTGTVKWFSDRKGFGFLIADAGPEAFVHRSALVDVTTLQAGQRVSFNITPGRTSPVARDVRVVE